MTEENVGDVFKLCAEYMDVMERVKIATIDDLRAKGHTLSVSVYIEKAAKETVPPAVVRADFADALASVKVAEARLTELLAKGGYTNG